MSGLVGRARELSALTELVRGVQAGAGGTIAMLGAAGMGKSRLLDEVTTMAEAAGVVVTRVGCAEADAAVPLTVARRLAAALDLADDGDGADEIAEHLNDRASRTPQLILLDDAQWIDAASLLEVLALVRVTNEAAVGFVFAARPPRADATTLPRLLASAERRGAHALVLRPLDDGEVAELVGAISNTAIDDDKHAVLAAVAGNPFLAVELAEAWLAGHAPSADSLLSHALSHVTARTRRMLESASVLGRDAAIADIAHMQRCPTGELADSVREAISAGLVDGHRGHVRFRHDLIRDAIYEGLPVAIRGALHRDAASALAARDLPPVELAFHLVQGALPGDRAAIGWLRQAASAAASCDLSEALHLLEAARRLCVDGSREAVEVDQRLIVFLAWVGRSEQAIHLAGELLDDPRLPRDAEPRLRAGLAEALARGGDEAAGAAEARRALEMEGMTPLQRATLLLLVGTGQWETDPVTCRETIAEARRLANDDAGVTFAALQIEGTSYAADMDLGKYVETNEAGVAFARRNAAAGRPLAAGHTVWALTNWAEAAMAAEREGDCLRALAELEREARRAGLTLGTVPFLMALRSEVHLQWCRWDDASAEVEARDEVLADQSLTDDAASGVPFRSAAVRARIAVHLGDSRAAAHLECWESVATHPVEAPRISAWRTLAAFLRGDEVAMAAGSSAFATQLRELERAGGIVARGIGWTTPWLPVHRALAGANRHDDAAFLAHAMLPVCAVNGRVARFAAASHTLRAFLEGRADLAAQGLEAAEQIAAPLLRFHALCDAASAATEIGASDLADRARRRIAELSEAHGMRHPAPLFDAGGTAPVRRRRVLRPLTGWASLTPTEVRTAELVAQGLSNRAIADDLLVSRYTVETHVKHIFQKLGLDSRVQLATFVVEQRERSDG